MGEALRQLAYKANQLVKVGRWYASSKTCSNCGYVNRELTISERTWACAGCGVLHERDWNAAITILQEGLRLAGT
jgi:putative transposase